MTVEQINTKLNNLRPILINAFLKYYGEEYKEKIITKINEITFVYVDNNYQYLGSSNEERILSDEPLMYKIKNVKDITACTFPKTYPPVIVLKEESLYKLNVLIHEINHTLHNEQIAEIEYDSNIGLISQFLPPKKEIIYQEGIPNNDLSTDDSYDNYFYEIINEYMTHDILQIMKEEKLDDFFSCENENIEYITYDKIVNNLILDIYILMKDIIKNNIINASGQIVRNIIGKDIYQTINKLLIKIQDMYNRFMYIYKKLNDNNLMSLEEEKKVIEKEFFKSLTQEEKEDLNNIHDKYYTLILNNFYNYIEYKKEINNIIKDNQNLKPLGIK